MLKLTDILKELLDCILMFIFDNEDDFNDMIEENFFNKLVEFAQSNDTNL